MTKKLYRDLRYSKGRSFSIIFIVALATGLYGGLFLAYINIVDTFEQAEEDSRIESVRFSLNDTNQNLINLNGFSSIESWDYRLAKVTTLEIEGDTTLYTAALFGIPGDREPRVNFFIREEGEYFNDINASEILLIKQFMEHHHLDIGNDVNIYTPTGLQSLSIGARVFSPEYIYNINPQSGLPDVTGLAAGWLTLEYLQSLYNLENRINEVLVRFNQDILDDEELYDAEISKIQVELQKYSSEVNPTKLSEEGEQTMKDADVGALDDMARAFGMVILFLALFAIYDNISKLISSQRNYIGTMRALGGSKTKVTLHYTLMGSILGLIGVIIGIPLGWGISAEMSIEYAHLLGIPTPSTAFSFPPFLEAIVIILGLSILLSFLSSLAASRIEPREAMSSSFVSMIFSAKPL
ncbi:MAG: ABC transporter permease, partial [Candidatus Kariarchaeaceae archaeon]